MKILYRLGYGMPDPFEQAWMVLKMTPKQAMEEQQRTAVALDQLGLKPQQSEADRRMALAREMDEFYYWNPDLAQAAGINPYTARTAWDAHQAGNPANPIGWMGNVFNNPIVHEAQMFNPQLQYGYQQYQANPQGDTARAMLSGQGYQAPQQQQQSVQRAAQKNIQDAQAFTPQNYGGGPGGYQV